MLLNKITSFRNVKNLNSEIRVALFNKEPEFLIAEFFFSLRSFADNKEHKNLYSFRIDGLRGKDSPEIELSVHLQVFYQVPFKKFSNNF